MPTNTREKIINATVPMLAKHGHAGTGMRAVAEAAEVQTSVIYHYFPTKNDLFNEVRLTLNATLDTAFDGAPKVNSAPELLRQRLYLHFTHMEKIVALLQYFIDSKEFFHKVAEGGYVPVRAYRHMLEIITRGQDEGVYTSDDPVADAKVLAHMVNGYMLEFYGHTLKKTEVDETVERLASFIGRALEVR